MFVFLRSYFSELYSVPAQSLPVDATIAAIIIIGAVAAYYLTKLVLKVVEVLISRTSTTWDDDLFTPRLLRAISQLTPAILIHNFLPRAFDLTGGLAWIYTLTEIYILGAIVGIITIFLSNLYNALGRRPHFKAYAVKGVFQMVQLILVCLGVIYAFALLAGRSPWAIFTALGASAAVLMLVFKDTILGLVASVQLSANKMLQRGDWIVCDKHGANGEVIDVSLTTVKVRNWDASVTTIPPYALISESFKNYQPMVTGGARRVDRAIIIDANSVRFCTKEEIESLAAEGWLDGMDVDAAQKHINLGLVRRYLEKWLSEHPDIRKDCTLMVRQLEPTSVGLPLQLYFFSSITAWKDYEHLQSDIFDHVYAILGRFGLRMYQAPAAGDVRAIADR